MRGKILVTGSTGFIGREFVRQLAKKKVVVCLIRKGSNIGPLKGLGVECLRCNLRDQSALNRTLKGISTVVHIAGTVSSDVSALEEANVRLTERLVRAAKKNRVKKFILISSAIVLLDKGEPYASSKFRAEEIVRKSGLGHVIIRPSLVYGPGDSRHLGGIIDMVKKCRVVPVVGDGKYRLQPVYVEDVAKAIAASLDRGVNGRAYTIAGPFPLEFNSLIDIIAQELGLKRRKLHLPAFMLKALAGVYGRVSKKPIATGEQIKRITSSKVYDISPATRELGYRPVKFRDGIRKTLVVK